MSDEVKCPACARAWPWKSEQAVAIAQLGECIVCCAPRLTEEQAEAILAGLHKRLFPHDSETP